MYSVSYKMRSGVFRPGIPPAGVKSAVWWKALLPLAKRLGPAALSGMKSVGSGMKGLGSRGYAFAGAHPWLTGITGMTALDMGMNRLFGGEQSAAPATETKVPGSTLSDLYSEAAGYGIPHALGGAGLGALASHAVGAPKWLGALGGGLAGYFGKDYINNALNSYMGGAAPQA